MAIATRDEQMTPTIRQATLTDLDAIVKLENKSFATDQLSRQNFRHLLKSPTAEIFLAVQQKKLLGNVIVLFRKNSTIARMYSLVVHKAFRKQGIANQLRKKIETSAKKRGCQQMILEVRINNRPAIQFYQKHGYQFFAKYTKFYQDKIDALRMRKAL